MPFLAPLLVGAVGAGTLGAAAIQIGLSVGLSYAAKKLRPKKKNASAEPRGVRVGLTVDASAPRTALIGECATGGSLAYWQLSGADNKILHMVVALADHECTSLQSVIVNGKPKSWNSTTGEVDGYGSSLVIRFYSGASGQTADAEVVAASGGRWTTNDKGVGVCYAVVRLTYSEELFPEGIPEFGFVVRGAKLIDPRTGLTAYNDNPAVALYNALIGFVGGGEPLFGMNVPPTAIRLSEAQAAANACDELMAIKAGGTEKRYRCGVEIMSTQTNRDIIETLLASMAGECICVGGIWRIFAGVAQTPVASLSDADIITAEPLVTRPKKSRNELTNAILGTFTDPARAYAQVPLPPRKSSSDETLDGARLSQSYDLVAVTSRTQGQRVLEVERKRARRMASSSMRVRARHFGLEPGDWVTWSSDRRGYASKTFVVHSTSGNRDLTSDIVLTEIDDAIDDWTASTDEIDDNQVIDLASAGPSLSSASGVSLVAVTLSTAGGIQRPGLQVQWTPITDPTVTEIEVEFRKSGDTIALKVPNVLAPSAGSYTWITGVQSGATYEARIRLVTRPARGVTWTSWITASAATGNQVVPIADLATSVPPDTITPAELDAQSRFQLSLTVATDEILGSVANEISGLIAQSNEASIATINALIDANEAKTQIRVERDERVSTDLALAKQITTISAQINTDIAAAIREEQEARTTADSALASDITTALSRIGDNELAVTVLQTSINGIEGKYGVAINANGHVVGLYQLDGSAIAGSSFIVAVDNFKIAKLGVAGGAAIPVFAVSTVGGVAKLALRGDMIADGSITARSLSVLSLSALSANLGTVTAGTIRDAANLYQFQVANGWLGATNGQMVIDLKNQIFRIGSLV